MWGLLPECSQSTSKGNDCSFHLLCKHSTHTHTHLFSFTAKTTCRMQGNKFSEKTEAEFTDLGHLNTHFSCFFLSWGELANRNRWFAQVVWKRSLDLPQLHIFTQQVQCSQSLGGKQEKKRATLSARKTVQLIQKGPNQAMKQARLPTPPFCSDYFIKSYWFLVTHAHSHSGTLHTWTCTMRVCNDCYRLWVAPRTAI